MGDSNSLPLLGRQVPNLSVNPGYGGPTGTRTPNVWVQTRSDPISPSARESPYSCLTLARSLHEPHRRAGLGDSGCQVGFEPTIIGFTGRGLAARRQTPYGGEGATLIYGCPPATASRHPGC